MSEADRAWQHPRLRVGRLIGVIFGTRWSADTWPTAKAALGWALAERKSAAAEIKQAEGRLPA